MFNDAPGTRFVPGRRLVARPSYKRLFRKGAKCSCARATTPVKMFNEVFFYTIRDVSTRSSSGSLSVPLRLSSYLVLFPLFRRRRASQREETTFQFLVTHTYTHRVALLVPRYLKLIERRQARWTRSRLGTQINFLDYHEAR